jgi:hypothetical protein
MSYPVNITYHGSSKGESTPNTHPFPAIRRIYKGRIHMTKNFDDPSGSAF